MSRRVIYLSITGAGSPNDETLAQGFVCVNPIGMKDKTLKWAGRGMTPVWMREEMKGTKLSKEDFAIK